MIKKNIMKLHLRIVNEKIYFSEPFYFTILKINFKIIVVLLISFWFPINTVARNIIFCWMLIILDTKDSRRIKMFAA